MGLLSKILRDGEDNRLTWWCPGCNIAHSIRHGVGAGPRWTWNGDVENPTFSPSVLVTYGPVKRCHSFVVDGRMQMLGDCTHFLAGQTVEIPEWPYLDE